MYFNHAFRKSFLLPNASVAFTNATTPNLTAGQLNAYTSTWASITGTESAAPFYLVQGSYFNSDKISPALGGYKESIKSKLINPKYISRVIKISAKTPVQNVVQVPVTCGIACDTTTRLRVDIKGSPALRFLSHNMYRTLDAYSGCCSTVDPTLVKDPVSTLINWADQINLSPIFNTMVQARVYSFKSSIGAASSSGISSWGTPGRTSATLTFSTNNTTGLAKGQKIVGTGMPANAFVTGLTATATATAGAGGTVGVSTYVVASGNTLSAAGAVGYVISGAGFPVGSYISAYTGTAAYTITFPTQAVAPTISGVFTASASATITYPAQQVAPTTIVTTAVYKLYNDLYSGAIDTPQVGALTVIPGTGTQTGVGGSAVVSNGISTTATIGASSSLLTSIGGAHVYNSSADAASFSYTAGQEPHIELTGAYVETKFGDCTFTPTDKYDIEPLLIYTSLTDESGDPCAVQCFTTSHSNTGTDTAANLATIIQSPIQAFGIGETVIRDMILSGRYMQLAYPDSSRVESLRMREIEADPAIAAVGRSNYYDQVLILHSVPRFNNPSGTFDNDQYLLVFHVPAVVNGTPTSNTTTGLTDFLVRSANLAQYGTATTSGTFQLESF